MNLNIQHFPIKNIFGGLGKCKYQGKLFQVNRKKNKKIIIIPPNSPFKQKPSTLYSVHTQPLSQEMNNNPNLHSLTPNIFVINLPSEYDRTNGFSSHSPPSRALNYVRCSNPPSNYDSHQVKLISKQFLLSIFACKAPNDQTKISSPKCHISQGLSNEVSLQPSQYPNLQALLNPPLPSNNLLIFRYWSSQFIFRIRKRNAVYNSFLYLKPTIRHYQGS